VTAIAILLALTFAVPPAAAEQVYRACPGGAEIETAADVSWRPTASAVRKHRDLRQRLHLPFPDAGERIFVHSFGSHHGTVEFSVVAVRRPDGIWHVDEAGEEWSALSPTVSHALPHKQYDLSTAQSRRVDAAIADRCLLASPTFLRDPNLAGGAMQTLEILSKRKHVILGWLGKRTREEEALLQLIARD
jgi:hypothetical protein